MRCLLKWYGQRVGAFKRLPLPKMVTIVCLENHIIYMFVLKLLSSAVMKFDFDILFFYKEHIKTKKICRIWPQ